MIQTRFDPCDTVLPPQVILDIGGHFYCQCFTHPVPARKLSFYHFCKTEEKIDGCLQKFGAC